MPKLLAIQILRALAALSVAALHAQHEAGLLAAAGSRTVAPSRILPWEAGVDVFFVISGFVMVFASRRMFAEPGARAVFLARRVARVVPLYWLATTLYLLVALARPGLLNGAVPTPGFVAASYLFVPAARPDGLVQPLFGLGWTLNFEMFFYVLVALVLGLSLRAATATLVAGLAGLALLGRLHDWPQPVATWTDPLVLEFAAGALLGHARAEGLALGAPLRIALAGTAFALFAVAAGPVELAGLSRAACYGAPAALLVASAGLGPESGPAASTTRWNAARFGAAFGDASYALYLIHPFALRGARVLVSASGLADVLGGWAFLAPALALTSGAALLVRRFVERPLTRAVRRLLEGGWRRSVARE